MLVEDIADFAGESTGRIGLLEDGESVAAQLVRKSEISAIARGEDNGDTRREAGNVSIHLGTAHFGEDNVDEQEIDFGSVRFEFKDGLFAVGSEENVVAEIGESLASKIAKTFVIFGDEDELAPTTNRAGIF